MNGFEEVVIRRHDEPDLVFCGRLVAEVTEEGMPDDDDLPLLSGLSWTRLRLYELADGRRVVVAEDLRKLGQVRRKAEVCATVYELIEFLGHTDLAKTLYQRAGIDARQRLDRGRAAPASFSELANDCEDEPAQHAGGVVADSADGMPRVEIVDRPKFERRLQAARKSDYQRQVAVLERLAQSGFERVLVPVKEEMLSELLSLELRFPNFREVIAHVHRQLALALLAEKSVLRIVPLLLAGPPGVGKTRFVKELAGLLGAEFHAVACNTTTASFVLSGGDSQWSHAKPGRIFEALAGGKSANPVMLLDEVDKMSTEARYDPYGPLYSVLEPETARRFVDEYVALEIDASHVVWVATANDTACLAEPILSRFKVLAVNPPTRAQMAAIAQSVYRDLLETEPWGLAFEPELPGPVLERLAGLTPRLLRQLLLDALGYAALRPEPGIGGAPLELSPADIELALARRLPGCRRPLGFTVEPPPAAP